jgi:hypothetical protein
MSVRDLDLPYLTTNVKMRNRIRSTPSSQDWKYPSSSRGVLRAGADWMANTTTLAIMRPRMIGSVKLEGGSLSKALSRRNDHQLTGTVR